MKELFNDDWFFLDIECSPAPPDIPTDLEYHLATDDGRVFMSNLHYPELEYQFREWDSANNYSLIPRNYMANLRWNDLYSFDE